MADLRCIIVEDEPLARRILEDYIQRVPSLKLVGIYEDAIDASEHLKKDPVDLMFLDIHLPVITGMSFLKILTNRPAIIITTAYHEYAVESYEFSVVDYLLKPFEFERFLAAVNKVSRPVDTDRMMADTSREYLLVNIQLRKVKIYFAEILYIESQKEYVKIVTESNAYVTKLSLHHVEALLPPALFRRVHRSFIVAIGKVRSFNSETLEINGVTIPVGRSFKGVLGEL